MDKKKLRTLSMTEELHPLGIGEIDKARSVLNALRRARYRPTVTPVRILKTKAKSWDQPFHSARLGLSLGRRIEAILECLIRDPDAVAFIPQLSRSNFLRLVVQAGIEHFEQRYGIDPPTSAEQRHLLGDELVTGESLAPRRSAPAAGRSPTRA